MIPATQGWTTEVPDYQIFTNWKIASSKKQSYGHVDLLVHAINADCRDHYRGFVGGVFLRGSFKTEDPRIRNCQISVIN